MKTIVLPLSDSRADLATVGGKGMSLAKLANAGLPVPNGFHITTEAYRQFVALNDLQPRIKEALTTVDTTQPSTLETAAVEISRLFGRAEVPDDLTGAITQAYTALPALDPAVAVRSSATAEDLPEASFAGQQDTYLNITGSTQVLEAVKRCWASLWTARAIGYRARQGISTEGVALAVVVQTLVDADAAGIMFTANPLNGRRDQIVINASWGLGEAVVGGAVTPDTVVVDRATGDIIERETADKQMMTVRTPTGTTEQPTPGAQRSAPVLTDAQAAELARLGAQIEELYSMPMDIEWAIAGGVISILQARPITALTEKTLVPEIEPPTDWPVSDPKGLYMRSSITELLPDPLTPLFTALGGRAINDGTVQLFGEIIGSDVVPQQIFITINEYAYYHMKTTFKFWWRGLTRVWSFIPELLRGEERWRDEARPRYLAVIERYGEQPLNEIAAPKLLEGAYQIVAEAVNIYNVYQSGVVGLATMTELLFTPFYEKLIRRKGEPPALTFLLGGDSMPIRAEKSLYDIAQWCRRQPDLHERLLNTPSDQLAALLKDEQLHPEGAETPDAPPATGEIDAEWQRRFRAHLADYGHAIYNLDFAVPLPADDPVPLLETLKLYLRGQGANPHKRQQEQIAQREAATEAIEKRLKGLRLRWFRKLLGWAQTYVPMREDTLADIGLGYPLLRRMLRELGRRLVEAGMLARIDDVYWLTEEEATEAAVAIDRDEALGEITETLRHRQALWRAARLAIPPAGLPERTMWTGLMDRVGPTRTQEAGHTIKGVGASPGRVTVPACVLHGPSDFDQMQPGCALVAAITTPAWTPLFAMAAAVVTDIGGPLSHGSIVAREYGIPAVLGTGEATKRIHHGQTITVDGEAGTVELRNQA